MILIRLFKTYRILRKPISITVQRTHTNLMQFCKNNLIQQTNFRKFSLKSRLNNDDDDKLLDEDSYWDLINDDIKLEENEEMVSSDLLIPSKEIKSPFSKSSKLKSLEEKKVFVLQLKMQFKSKTRQSTTAELQLAESIALIETLDRWKVVDSLIVGTKHVNSREIFGMGNQELISKKIPSSGANCLFVVIDRLTNIQVETLRKTLLGNNSSIQIYDRYKVVLEIFKRNAHSSIAKLQIALAEIPYIRHRYDNFELYKSVEKKIKKQLTDKLKSRFQTSSLRKEKKFPTVAVFGYTNAGKTSFIKSLTNDEKMKPENKLFATLDITYHHLAGSTSSNTQNILFADTIGFISDIPHTLVESFKTTINDALDADLFLHLIDISHPDRITQEEVVLKILTELAPKEKIDDMITVYNKCDLARDRENLLNNRNDAFLVSCKTGEGLEEIKENLKRTLYKKLGFIELNLKVGQGSDELSFLYKNSMIKNIGQCNEDLQFLVVKVLINRLNAIKLTKLFPNIKIYK